MEANFKFYIWRAITRTFSCKGVQSAACKETFTVNSKHNPNSSSNGIGSMLSNTDKKEKERFITSLLALLSMTYARLAIVIGQCPSLIVLCATSVVRRPSCGVNNLI